MSADSKIGLLATIDNDCYPHISFITSIQPKGERQFIAGQFCAGLSKKNILKRAKTGFLILTPEMELWRGLLEYERSADSGPDFDMYNQRPLFRYNSYFGIGLVHYFRLIDISAKEQLSKGQIISGALKTRLVRPFVSKSVNGALNDLSSEMFKQLDGLKFIAWVNSSGYPLIIPLIQAANAGRDRIAFSLSPYRQELEAIPDGAPVAVFFVNLKMESVLVKGTYRPGGGLIKHGLVDIKRVYNSMPPQPGYIYPKPIHHEKVISF